MIIKLRKNKICGSIFIFIGILFCNFIFADNNSVSELRKLAKSGNAEAQLKIGTEYFYGRNLKQDYTLAAHWLKKAMKNGNKTAIYNYAVCIRNGFGVEKNEYKAYRLFVNAAEKDISDAQFCLAQIFKRGIPPDKKLMNPAVYPNAEKRYKLLKKLTEKNYKPAYAELAEFLMKNPEKSSKGRKKVIELLRQSADCSDPKGMRLLADCFFLAYGVAKNRKKAVNLLEKSKENGDLEACSKLAYLFENGIEVQKDSKKALKLFYEAAKGGHIPAQIKIGDYYLKGKMLPQSIPKAQKWYKMASEKNSSKALFKLGVLAYEGLGQKKNMKKASDYFYQSAKLGYPRAQFNLAIMFQEGQGFSKKNPQGAFYWFKQAASSGLPAAQRKTAECYINGTGTEKDFRKAVLWLKYAAENGDRQAAELLHSISY